MAKYKLLSDVSNAKSFRHNLVKYNPLTITQKELKYLYKSGFDYVTEIKTKTSNEEVEKNNTKD